MIKYFRKIHIYLGLALLPLILLFSASGLLLNNPDWRNSRFWPLRQETATLRSIEPPRSAGDLALAEELMRQLGISGELERTVSYPGGERFDFQVVRPGRITEVKCDLAGKKAALRYIETNKWGALFMLHTFTGVRQNETAKVRDWLMTMIWSATIDAVALGLILMVLSSFYLAFKDENNKRLKLTVLGLGVLSAAFFVFGLDWLF